MKINKTAFAVLAVYAPFSLAQETNNSIEEIRVLGQEFSSVSESGSRLALSLKEIPATIDVIDGDSIRNRHDLTLLNAVTRSAGFTGAGNPGNGGTSISARGFTGQDAVTKLYDGNQYFTLAGTITFPFDTWAVDKVEVLKGPASVLYGQGGVAGAYNVIPKTPSEDFDADIRLSAGENNEYFLGAGISGSLHENIKGRIDYSRTESDNWVNNGESESEMIALAFEWKATEDLSLMLRYDAGEQSPLRYFGIPVVDGGFNEEWVGLNLSVADTQINYDDEIVRLIADWAISDSVNFNGELFSLDTDRYWQTVETYSYDSSNDTITRADPLIIRHELEQIGARGNFSFFSQLGNMPLKMSLGFESTGVNMNYISNFNSSHPNSVDWDNDVDVVDPNNFVAGLWSDVTDSVAALDQVSDVQQTAIFAESQLRLTDDLAVVGAIRYDNIETDYERLTYDDSGERDTSVDNSVNQKINPVMFRLGFVYDINPSTSLYGQTSTGETHPRGGDIVRVSNSYRESDTVTVEQFEIGLKQSFFEDRLNWNLALFDITKQDLQIDDPDNADPTIFITIDEQRSKGIEAGFDFAVNNNLVTYINAAVIDSERDTGTEFVPTDYVPDMTVNAGVLYNLTDNVRMGADYRYVDERPYEDSPLPSYSLVDLSFGYNLNKNTRMTLNAKNVFDKLYASSDHWTGGQWSVGQPRSLSLSLDLDF